MVEIWKQYSDLFFRFKFTQCELLEALRDALPIPCINACNGCNVALFQEALEKHEELCIFRKISCADLDCKEKPIFKDYVDHFNSVHQNGAFQEDSDVFNADFDLGKESKVFTKTPRRLVKFGRNFFETGQMSNGLIRRWIFFQGSPFEAKNFG